MSQPKTARNGKRTTRKAKDSGAKAKSRTPRVFTKAAGGDVGEAFRQKLRGLVGPSQRAFAAKLGITSSRKVSAWLSGEQWPGADSLKTIAEKTDVSIDWLLGFDVPQRRRDRAVLGVVADALVRHVAADYLSRPRPHPYVSSLADVLGGEVKHFPPHEPPGEVPEGSVRIVPREAAPDGTLAVIDIPDPQEFLTEICRWVFEQAESREWRTVWLETTEIGARISEARGNLAALPPTKRHQAEQALRVWHMATHNAAAPQLEAAVGHLVGRLVDEEPVT